MFIKSNRLIGLILLILATTFVADAQRRTTSRTSRAVATPGQRTKALMPTLQGKIENLNNEVDRVARRGSVGGEITDALSDYISRLDESTNRLADTLATNPDAFVNEELRQLLLDATRVDQFLTRNKVSPSTQTQWRSIKRDLTSLTTYNRMSWNWRQTLPAETVAIVTPTPSPTPMPTPVIIATPYPTPIATPLPLPLPLPTPSSGRISYTVSDAQMSTLLSRIDLKTDFFRTQLQESLRASNADVTDNSIMAYVTRLVSTEERLRQNFQRGETSLLDLTDVLTAATYIDQFVSRNRLSTEAMAQWRDLRSELNTLATYHQQSWNWNQSLPSSPTSGTVNLRNIAARLTGTFRLNQTLSDEPSAAIASATASMPGQLREEQRISLERRLRAPEMMALEMNDRTVTMASSILPKVTFQADGRARSETNERGRTLTTTATVDGDGLTVNFQGERASDFYFTIAPVSGGGIRVTRRIYVDNSNEPIRVTSVYDRIDRVARWADLAPPNTAVTPGMTPPADVVTPTGPVENSLLVPAGTQLTGELRTPINGNQANGGFAMVVTTPGQFRGATIAGRVLTEDPNSRVSGRSRVLIAFDTITLRNGRAYRFAGDITGVTTPNGDVVEVTTQRAAPPTPQRGAGSILGALIGAIAGVPTNQAGAVGGSILAQRGETFYLGVGSQINLTTTAVQP